MLRPGGNEVPKGLRIMLKHIREGAAESLEIFITCFGKIIISRGCSQVTWPFEICSAIPVLTCGQAQSVEPELDTIPVLVGVAAFAG